MKNNPNGPQLDEFDFNKTTYEDIIRLLNSQFRIKWQFKSYAILDIKNRITVAMGFGRWTDALIFLKENAQVI